MDVELSPQESARRRVRVTPLVVGIVCAVLLGIALTLQITSWSTLATESGGSCGTSHGISHGPCPRGMAWLIPVSIVALIILVPATLLSVVQAAPRRIGCAGAVVLVGLGVLPGLAIFHWAHGTTLKTVWTAQPDRPSDVRGLGVWLRDTTIVRARYDGLVGYDVATGAKRWTYTLPGTDVLCAMSRTTASGVGLIAHGAGAQPCGRLTAVDLGTGRALWQQSLPAARGLSSSVTPDVWLARPPALVDRGDGLQGDAGGARAGAPGRRLSEESGPVGHRAARRQADLHGRDQVPLGHHRPGALPLGWPHPGGGRVRHHGRHLPGRRHRHELKE